MANGARNVGVARRRRWLMVAPGVLLIACSPHLLARTGASPDGAAGAGDDGDDEPTDREAAEAALAGLRFELTAERAFADGGVQAFSGRVRLVLKEGARELGTVRADRAERRDAWITLAGRVEATLTRAGVDRLRAVLDRRARRRDGGASAPDTDGDAPDRRADGRAILRASQARMQIEPDAPGGRTLILDDAVLRLDEIDDAIPMLGGLRIEAQRLRFFEDDHGRVAIEVRGPRTSIELR